MATNSSFGYLPVGSIIYYAGNGEIPSTFLRCDGTNYDRETYSVLFDVLGTSYGSTSATNFKVPDLINYYYIKGGAQSSGVPSQAVIDVPPFLLNSATLPSLAQGNFVFDSWNLTANINNGVWFSNSTPSVDVVPSGSDDTVKANSTDQNNYTGAVTGGTIGFTNPAQETIDLAPDPTTTVELQALSLIPLIKAWYDFLPPTYTPLPVSTDSGIRVDKVNETEYTTNPTGIYLDDPQLSGFVFEKPTF
ncbi:hypothetical protein [Dishui Lake virophage 2]|nr:hypothetical protein [Dishui Lake virophage 2]